MKSSSYINLFSFIFILVWNTSCLKMKDSSILSVQQYSDAKSMHLSEEAYREMITRAGEAKKSMPTESRYQDNVFNNSIYKIAVPNSSEAQLGLLVYLHGDYAFDYYKDDLFQPLVEYANKLNMIAINVRSLEIEESDGLRWYEKPKQQGDFLDSLLNKLIEEYNIDTNKIYLTGSSGGSQFITGMFVSRYIGLRGYGGGAIPVCGGANIYSDRTAEGMPTNITDNLKKHFKIYYYTGTADFLYYTKTPDGREITQVPDSKKHYTQLGVTVSGEHPYGATHCQNDKDKVTKITPIEGVKKAFNFFNETTSNSQQYYNQSQRRWRWGRY